jgi:hypothetical protein
MPETWIQQVECRVLHAAVIPVNGRPVVHSFPWSDLFIIIGVGVTQKIPAWACPLRHCVCFSFSRTSAFGTNGWNPIGHCGKRALPCLWCFIIFNLRQYQRQLTFGQRNKTASLAVNYGYRLTPVPLTRENPVTELKINFFLTKTVFDKPLCNFTLSILNSETVNQSWVYHCSAVTVLICFFFHITAANDLDYRQSEFLGKLPVTGIMSGNCHNCACAVWCKYVIGYKNRYLFFGYRVNRAYSFYFYTCFFLFQFCALKIGFFWRGFLINAQFCLIVRFPFLK